MRFPDKIKKKQCAEGTGMNGELYFEKAEEIFDMTAPRRGTFVRREEDGVTVLDGVCGDGTVYATIIPSGREEAVSGVLARSVSEIAFKAGAKRPRSILVVGLGNASVEADSLGPLSADRIAVGKTGSDGFVFALKPGVREQSGISSSSLVRAVAVLVEADLVITVDALAAINPDRIGSVIQVADGIRPGGGIDRSSDRLEIPTPLVSVGVPTAVYGTLSRAEGSAKGLFTACGIGAEVVFRAVQIAKAINFFTKS